MSSRTAITSRYVLPVAGGSFPRKIPFRALGRCATCSDYVAVSSCSCSPLHMSLTTLTIFCGLVCGIPSTKVHNEDATMQYSIIHVWLTEAESVPGTQGPDHRDLSREAADVEDNNLNRKKRGRSKVKGEQELLWADSRSRRSGAFSRMLKHKQLVADALMLVEAKSLTAGIRSNGTEHSRRRFSIIA